MEEDIILERSPRIMLKIEVSDNFLDDSDIEASNKYSKRRSKGQRGWPEHDINLQSD